MFNRTFFAKMLFPVLIVITLGWGVCRGAADVVAEPYLLDAGLLSRSISFENSTGAPGQGGKAASQLGVGRKGSPAITLNAGQDVQLCDIEGPGTIRHIWMTTSNDPLNLRSLVLRAWWDGQGHPSIECPIGDFMGFAHGKVMPYHSAVHSLGRNAGMNIWLPMPFTKRAKITLTNEGEENVPLFYQIDYTIKDKHPVDVGRLHVLFRRENPTTLKKDFVMLPQRKNKGRFMGALIGIRNLTPGQWWGEGEIKVYMDGDTEFPTICGTGSEDYVGLSYGMQQTPYLYNGCNLDQNNFVSMYRWHLPDPIWWQKECHITIQQIAWKDGLAETQDDWSSATFWYEPIPSEALPAMPDVTLRTVNIWSDEKDVIKLFNSKDLTGWETSGEAKWVVENGMLIGTQGEKNAPGDLFTKETYKDFVATVTYRTEWPCNSGLWFHYQSPQKAYQADVLEYKNPVAWSGTLYCPGKMFLAINEDETIVNRDDWNTIIVRAQGGHVQVWLNGRKTADVHDDTTDSGKIGFQVHPGEEFGPMKIIVRELSLRPL